MKRKRGSRCTTDPYLILLKAKLFEVCEEADIMPADSNVVHEKRTGIIFTIIGHLHRCGGDLCKAKAFVFNDVLDAHNYREFRNHLLNFYRENVVPLVADVGEVAIEDLTPATTEVTGNPASSLTNPSSR